MTRYQAMFDRLDERGEGAFVPFVMLGDPTPEKSLRVIEALIDGGADGLELGIPFSDPIADGPTIQAAAVRALEAGVRPDDCWEVLRGVRRRAPEIPIGLLVYSNLVVNESIDAFYQRAADVGVDSVLIADVPTLEIEPFHRSALTHGVDPVLIAPPNASEDRLKEIASLSRGYTYVVTRAGVTGAREELKLSHSTLLGALKRLGAPPSLFGFGISQPEHVRQAIAGGAAGAISGSAVVKIVAREDSEEAILDALRRFVREMKAATTR